MRNIVLSPSKARGVCKEFCCRCLWDLGELGSADMRSHVASGAVGPALRG